MILKISDELFSQILGFNDIELVDIKREFLRDQWAIKIQLTGPNPEAFNNRLDVDDFNKPEGAECLQQSVDGLPDSSD